MTDVAESETFKFYTVLKNESEKCPFEPLQQKQF